MSSENDRLTTDALWKALTRNQFQLVYQPIVTLKDRKIIGVEALVRWDHPEHGNVPPLEFIPIAEHSGLIVSIGQWIMTTACTDMAVLQKEYGVYVSVNVSTRQLIHSNFATWVLKVLARAKYPPSALMVELTESVLMEDTVVMKTAFDRLRLRGVQVAIDDFGTGFSSLARLQSFPIDVIKLDRAFVTDIDVHKIAQGMATAILQLSAAVGAEVIVEGVETEAEAKTLINLGFTKGQGFLYSRPQPIEFLTASLLAQSSGG
jgi:EAL domain-containing protein (putative c-di-GMP-specific phosphodiesterase class I)